ncbi:hypothetical protein LCGC14_3017920 [marine sediment metagenome]|uniref:Uncharacterized protein n=1 Tax=marine sediment metagenome TaxID=412755 RepID=A0A0F8WWN6_9ZZZZ
MRHEIRSCCLKCGNTQGVLRRVDSPLKTYVCLGCLRTYRSAVVKRGAATTVPRTSISVVRVLVGELADRLKDGSL